MGVDARISLPGNVRLRTVIDVMAKLLGAPVKKEDLNSRGHPGAWYARADRGVVEYQIHDSMPECVGVTIHQIDSALIGQKSYHFLYHFEFGGSRGRGSSRGMMSRSYASNIALYKRLADFFGGTVDYSDCDSNDCDYVVPAKTDSKNCPEDGDPWQNLQKRIMAIQPLTNEEIDALDHLATYNETSEDRLKRLEGSKS